MKLDVSPSIALLDPVAEKERCEKIVRDCRMFCAGVVALCWTSAAISVFKKSRQAKK